MSQHKQLLTQKQLKYKLKAVQKMYLYKYLRPINDINEKLLIEYIFELEKQFRKLTWEQRKLNSNDYGTKRQQRELVP